jgi:uncharacterized protein (DUF169 family)
MNVGCRQMSRASRTHVSVEARQNETRPIRPASRIDRARLKEASFRTAAANVPKKALRSIMAGIIALMPDYPAIESKLLNILQTARRPVAVTYIDTAPSGIPLFAGSQPSSCSFWRLAAGGRSFYTVPADHFNCPVGSYTHHTLTPEKMPELQQTLDLMTGIGYIRMEEIPGVFQLPATPQFVVYTPLAETPGTPSAVLAAGKPGRLMMLVEAANRAGALSQLPMLGRPTCMALPAALQHGMVTSAGCIGNRVYTEIGDEEMYVVLRGSDLEKIAAEVETILSANQTLTQFHRERREILTRL